MNSRTLAAAFWANFFALYWLLILGVVKVELRTSAALLLFFIVAAVLSAMHLDTPKQKGGNGRK